MGNEGSVPEGHGTDDELEHQARAPPSYSNPSQSTMQSRPGGRIANALRRDKSKQNAAGEQVVGNTGNGYPVNGDDGMTYSTGGERAVMSQAQQRQNYQQQEMSQIQQRAEIPSNQYHESNGIPQQPNVHAQGQRKNDTSGAQQQDVGATYTSPPRGKKGGMNFRSSGRGAAIINSMKSLSISNAIQKAADKAKSGKGAGGEVNEWETKWDEDDDDDDESDDAAERMGSHGIKPLHPQAVSTSGHSNTALMVDEKWPQSQQKAHLVTATPESDLRPAELGATADSAGWDTDLIQDQQSQDKPNVQMFLPLLRVLGKGSFGKVRVIPINDPFSYDSHILSISRLC